MFTFKEQTGQKTQGNGDYAIYSITCTISKSRVWGFVTSEQTVVSLILTDHSPRCHPWMGFGVLQHQPLIGVRRTIMLLRWSRNSVSLRTHHFIEIYQSLFKAINRLHIYCALLDCVLLQSNFADLWKSMNSIQWK